LSKNSIKDIRHHGTKASISLILMLIFAFSLIALPTTNAHTPPWTLQTYAYINVAPNPAGVGQDVTVVAWINWPSPTAIGDAGDRWRDYEVVVTAPDKTTQILTRDYADPASSTFWIITPTQTGVYTFNFSWPGQSLSQTGPTGIVGQDSPYINDTFLGAEASTTLTVQDEAIPKFAEAPLPTSYWTRPIYGENTNWYPLGSNWLGGEHELYKWQRYGTAPNSPHIVWTKPYSFGGIVGGVEGEAIDPAMAFYDGTAYEFKFSDALIMYGNLYYAIPRSNNNAGGGVAAVNLRTGEQLWYNPDITTFSFGQFYDFESPNQHGIIPNGYLWSVSGFFTQTWTAYDPMTGQQLFTLTDIPSAGFFANQPQVWGETGEITRYFLGGGSSSTPYTYFTVWNNTKSDPTAPSSQQLNAGSDPLSSQEWRPVGKTIPMGSNYSYTMNVTLSEALPPGSVIRTTYPGDIMFGRGPGLQQIGTTAFISDSPPTPDPYTLWAVNLNASRGKVGKVLWINEYPAPAGNLTVMIGYADAVTRTFNIYYKETRQWLGYDLDTGDKLWGPTASETPFNYYGGTTTLTWPYGMGYGRMYSTGFGGILYAYNLTNGNLEFEFGDGGEGNSTNSGIETVYGRYPLQVVAIADNKVFISTSEHSYNEPKYKGAEMHAVDAMTGEEIWRLSAISPYQSVRVADGYLVFLNLYDQQIYSIGPGPSATTVTASPKITVQGSSVMIEGTVTDQSPGAKGTPAISDEYMRQWMEYTYMQQAFPADAKGVNVTLTAMDPNGNLQEIGTVTSDTSGMFKKMWEPPVPGEYTIMASFAGSDSYGPSSAHTSIGIEQPPAATPPPTPTPAPLTDTYVAGFGIALIIIVVAGLVVIVWMLKKR
jgi:hypothetical protein